MGDGGGDLNYTMVVNHLALCFWLILSLIASKGNAEKRSYMTYDMAVICNTHPNFKIRMHHSGTGSTGILKATDYLSEDEEKECVAVIRPPSGYGVIFHLDDVKLRKDANYDCRDYMKMYNETSRNNTTAPMCRDCCRYSRADPVCSGKCGFESDGLICEEFCDKGEESFIKDGTGQSLVVHYHTRCGACANRKQQVGFRMVFTAYRLLPAHDAPCIWPSDFQCDNGRCIWSGLTCDGYNNCGDMSDENKSGNSHCGGFPDPIKAAIIASAVIVTVLLGVVLAYFPKMSWGFILGQKRKNASSRLSHRHVVKKPSHVGLIANKPGHSRCVSFQTPLPKIKEQSNSETEI